MLLWSRACDEQELSWCQLRDGDLSKDSPSGRQHVADISQAHLKTHRSKDTESERGMQSYRSLGLLLKRKEEERLDDVCTVMHLHWISVMDD